MFSIANSNIAAKASFILIGRITLTVHVLLRRSERVVGSIEF